MLIQFAREVAWMPTFTRQAEQDREHYFGRDFRKSVNEWSGVFATHKGFSEYLCAVTLRSFRPLAAAPEIDRGRSRFARTNARNQIRLSTQRKLPGFASASLEYLAPSANVRSHSNVADEGAHVTRALARTRSATRPR